MTAESDFQIPCILGHRGASRDAPENTLEAFRLAWEQGADGIEADFRLTSDGRIVCVHDETTARTTGVRLGIADSTLDQLRALDAGHYRQTSCSGTSIPTLEEVLAALPDGSRFNIEIKCGQEIIPPLKEILEVSGVSPDRIRLLTFDAALIAGLRRQLPDWRTCWLCDYRHSYRENRWMPSKGDVLETLRSCGAHGLASADSKILDRDFIDELRKNGREIQIWTVDRVSAARRLCALGVDAIMTNRPGWLRAALMRGKVSV